MKITRMTSNVADRVREELKIFLSDDSKSGPLFKKFLAESNISLEDLYSLTQKEIENLITITSI